jgi:hypothetical protein
MKITFSFCLLMFTSFSYAGCGEAKEGVKTLSAKQGCSPSTSINQAAAIHCTDQSAIHFAKQFYRENYYFFSGSDSTIADQVYTADFKRAITDHAECGGDKGICNLNFDPWLNAQDGSMDGGIEYSVHRIEGSRVSVDLNYQFRVHPTYPSMPQKVSLMLNKVDRPQCWALDDMLMPDRASMKALMKKEYEHFYYYKKTRLNWNLLSSDIDSSTIAVMRDKQLVAEYVLNCDMRESVNVDPEQLEGEMNKVGLVVTPSNPQGFLITSCRVGAHSKALTVYDLARKQLDPVWEMVGSYFGEWSINQNYDLVLSYDEPCDQKHCDAPFIEKDVIWGEVDTRGGNVRN